jgi:hypothetical protein
MMFPDETHSFLPISPGKDPLVSPIAARLAEHEEGLKRLVVSLRDLDRTASRAGNVDPERLMRRLYRASEEDGSLEDEGYRQVLDRARAWTEGLLQSGEEYRREMIRFAERCQRNPVIAGLPIFREPPGVAAERLERAVVGLAAEIEEQMPEDVLLEQSGHFVIRWSKADGWLDGEGWWESPRMFHIRRHPAGSFPLQPAARSAMRSYAEVSDSDSDVLADRLLGDLKEGKLCLPDFTLTPGSDDLSHLSWSPRDVEIPEVAGLSAPGDARDRDEEGSLSLDVEGGIRPWDSHSEVAAVLESLLDEAFAQRSAQAPRPAGEVSGAVEVSLEIAGVLRIVRAVQELTGCTPEEAGLLLAPLLERRIANDCGTNEICTRYQRAMEFLAGQFHSA